MYIKTDNALVSEFKTVFGDNKLKITFKWANGVEQVYIYKTRAEEPAFDIESTQQKPIIYTLNEYKTFRGYVEEINEAGQFTYYFFPFTRQNGVETIFIQPHNAVRVDAGRVTIFYNITEKKKIFSNKKIISLTVKADAAVDKNILCYVIKQSGYPQNKDDGVMYKFMDDFSPGINTLPQIIINTDEFINIFLTHPELHQNFYELKVV